ncbi:MAG: FHA domain-containing protein [Deltaproteobacteria bacterium]|nr:FHA domain-containing protein [Deltaproteobacteria bacterium]
MAVTLIVTSPGAAPQTITLDQPRIVVGRAVSADVRLPARAVSAQHAVLHVHGNDLSIVDEGSTNGTRVNQVAIPRGRRKALKPGDLLGIAQFELRVELSPGVPDPPDRTGTLARKLLLDALASAGGAASPPQLELLTGRKAGSRWTLAAPLVRWVAGRGEGCEVLLDDPDSSRQHAEFVRDDLGVVVRDLGSKNGIFVGERRTPERRLRSGDEVTIGRSVLRFEDPMEDLLRTFEAGTDDSAPEPAPAPAPAVASAPPEASPTPAEASPAPAPAEGSPAPAVASPSPVPAERSPEPPVVVPRRGGAADGVVVLLALVILAVSLGALWMVLRTTPPGVNVRAPPTHRTAPGAD